MKSGFDLGMLCHARTPSSTEELLVQLRLIAVEAYTIKYQGIAV